MLFHYTMNQSEMVGINKRESEVVGFSQAPESGNGHQACKSSQQSVEGQKDISEGSNWDEKSSQLMLYLLQ